MIDLSGYKQIVTKWDCLLKISGKIGKYESYFMNS